MPRDGAAKAPEKTNVTRVLETLGIAHRVLSYDYDLEDLSALSAAAKIGLDPSIVYKTLALRGERRGVFLCCVPAGAEVDLKKAAKAALEKSVAMLPLAELQAATGYLRGGCSPIGTRRACDVLVDESARDLGEISISAGRRGCQVLLATADLMRALGGRGEFADIS